MLSDSLLILSQTQFFSNSLFNKTLIFSLLSRLLKSLNLAKSVLSSAYDMILNISLAFVKSFRYMMNKSGPRIDPCGPHEHGFFVQLWFVLRLRLVQFGRRWRYSNCF